MEGEPDQAMQDAEKKDQPSEGDLHGRIGTALEKGDRDLFAQADATLDVTTTQKLELMTSVYSPVTKQWSPPSALTANTGLDYAPTIASAPDGVVMVAWRYNPAGELIGTRAAPDQIRVATWRNGVWSAPVTVVDSLAGLAEISLAATNGRALAIHQPFWR